MTKRDPNIVFMALAPTGSIDGVECFGGPLDGQSVDKDVDAFRFVSVIGTPRAEVIEYDYAGRNPRVLPTTNHEGWYVREHRVTGATKWWPGGPMRRIKTPIYCWEPER
jgi:hypothetical protein